MNRLQVEFPTEPLTQDPRQGLVDFLAAYGEQPSSAQPSPLEMWGEPQASRGANALEIEANADSFRPILAMRPDNALDRAGRGHERIMQGESYSDLPPDEALPWFLFNAAGAAAPVRGMIAAKAGAGAVPAVKRGLAMDEASRMARAKQMGFDTDRTLYHQTHKDNLSSLMDEGFDLSRVGARGSDEGVPDGVFLKGNDADIMVGGEGSNAAQVPIHPRVKKTRYFTDRDTLKRDLMRDPVYKTLSDRVDEIDKLRAKEFDVLWEDKKLLRRENKDAAYRRKSKLIDKQLADWNAELKVAATEARARATKILGKDGYDSIRFSDSGSFGRQADTMVVLDTKNVRHVEAAFDPAKSESSNILAVKHGAGGAAVAVNQGFYSKALKEAQGLKQAKGTAQQMGAQLTKAGVKPDEMKYTGLNKWLDGREKAGKPVTQDELVTYLDKNQVKVDRVVLGENATANKAQIEEVPAGYAVDAGDSREFAGVFNTRAEAEQFARELGSLGAGPTKFSQWQLPGGENYREVLWKLPKRDLELPPGFKVFENEANGSFGVEFPDGTKLDGWSNLESAIKSQAKQKESPQFTGGHSEQFGHNNILAHARVNDRIDSQGRKVLFVEELQSDWAQKGRSAGFKEPDADRIVSDLRANRSAISDKMDGMYVFSGEGRRQPDKWFDLEKQRNAIDEQVRSYDAARSGVPSAPFVENTNKWVEFSLKNLLNDAAEGGYDSIAWTPGKVQIDRYAEAMRQNVKSIQWEHSDKGHPKDFRVVNVKGVHDDTRFFIDGDGKVVSANFAGKDLSEVVGKGVAEKIMKDVTGELPVYVLNKRD